MDNKITITWAITVKDELVEVTNLLNFLQLRIGKDDEILIQYDNDNATSEVIEYLNIVDKMHENHKVVGFPLNNDFATFKNNLTKEATKDYIVNIDADEIPNEFFMENIHHVLEDNPVDLVFIPRINTVKGITQEHIQKWRWRIDNNGWINFPDYQTRVYKRTDEITWMGKVHETITGYNTFSNFPPAEEWSFYHHKEIQRQERQNEYYNTI